MSEQIVDVQAAFDNLRAEVQRELIAAADTSGSLARMFSILVGTLHQEGIVDGNAVAQSIRLDQACAEGLRMSTADLINRIVAKLEDEGTISPKLVE